MLLGLVVVLDFHDELELIEVKPTGQLGSLLHATLGRVLLLPLEVLGLVEWEVMADHILQLTLSQDWQVFICYLRQKIEELIFVDVSIVVLIRAKQELELHVGPFLRILSLEEIQGLHKFVKVDDSDRVVVLGILGQICVIWTR